MSKFELNVKNGKVEYLMKSGKDVVKSETTEQNADWIIKNRGVEKDEIEGFPEYPVYSGGFYFAGKWKEEKNIFDDGVKKPRKRRVKDSVLGM